MRFHGSRSRENLHSGVTGPRCGVDATGRRPAGGAIGVEAKPPPAQKPVVSFDSHRPKRCSVVFKQLVIRLFSADFDLRGRPPVYKTAALPIELRRRSPEGIASLNPTDSELEAAPETAKTVAWRFLSPGKHHLSEKQLVIHGGRAVESMPGIVRGDERRGQPGARKDESTVEKAKNSWSYRNRWSRQWP